MPQQMLEVQDLFHKKILATTRTSLGGRFKKLLPYSRNMHYVWKSQFYQRLNHLHTGHLWGRIVLNLEVCSLKLVDRSSCEVPTSSVISNIPPCTTTSTI